VIPFVAPFVVQLGLVRLQFAGYHVVLLTLYKCLRLLFKP
jgi:hypothetical protein